MLRGCDVLILSEDEVRSLYEFLLSIPYEQLNPMNKNAKVFMLRTEMRHFLKRDTVDD